MKRSRAPRLGADGAYLRFNTEAELQNALERHALQLGFLVFHDELARGHYKGFPDLVIAGFGIVLYVECKGPKGSTTDAQERWQAELSAAGQDVRVASTERNEDYENLCAVMDGAYQNSITGGTS